MLNFIFTKFSCKSGYLRCLKLVQENLLIVCLNSLCTLCLYAAKSVTCIGGHVDQGYNAKILVCSVRFVWLIGHS